MLQCGQMKTKPNTSSLLDLADYDRVIVSFSGGKDSLACVLHLIELGVPRERIQLWHQCIDGNPHDGKSFMDWPVTEQYCKDVAAALGIEIRMQWREEGFEGEMLRNDANSHPIRFEGSEDGIVREAPQKAHSEGTRMKFPQLSANLSVRWCSAYLKIDVAARAIANDPALKAGTYLFITGERRQESAARAGYAEIEKHRTSGKARRVDQWRAVIDWDEAQIWDIIERYRIRVHPAYRMGIGRVSCMGCIFSDNDQWATVAALDPERFERIAQYEEAFDTTIRRDTSVRVAAAKGTAHEAVSAVTALAAMGTGLRESVILADDETWTRPRGAFVACGGPS